MTRTEINLHLRHQPFEPFDVVASSGGRYRVRHPELAMITAHGTIYVFGPARNGDHLPSPDVVSLLHVVALEPVRREADVSNSS